MRIINTLIAPFDLLNSGLERAARLVYSLPF